jgi:DNA-binding transcriptional ArsR family regulator
MHFFLQDEGEGQKLYRSFFLNNQRALRCLSNDLVKRMLQELAREPKCAIDVAKRLGEHEQKVYYHLRKLEGFGLVKVERTEERGGAVAKVYSPVAPFVSMKLYDSDPIYDVRVRATELSLLHPFLRDGRLESTIVIGSPEPHGKFKAPSSDGYCAIDLCFFLGMFLDELKVPLYKLDTQVGPSDLEGNLILIGGPKANMISYEVNEQLPIRFEYSAELSDWNIVSSLSRTTYRDKNVGIICKCSSPFASGKEIFILAGKGFRGTRAAVLGLVRHAKEVDRGNSSKPEITAKVVKGVDVDADGIIDEVEFLE